MNLRWVEMEGRDEDNEDLVFGLQLGWPEEGQVRFKLQYQEPPDPRWKDVLVEHNPDP